MVRSGRKRWQEEDAGAVFGFFGLFVRDRALRGGNRKAVSVGFVVLVIYYYLLAHNSGLEVICFSFFFFGDYL